jgi:sialidase-1
MSPQYVHRPSAIATVYSDDHGKTWQRGEVVASELRHPSEHMAVELAGGSVMLNIRSEGDEHLRAVAVGKDGATGWSKPVLQPDLYDPVCMASLLRLSQQPERKNRLVFSNPDSRGVPGMISSKNNMRSRDNLTLRISYDEAKTWAVSKLLEPGGTGYSDLAAGPDGAIFALYERVEKDGSREGKHNLVFARISLEWLTDNQDSWEKR